MAVRDIVLYPHPILKQKCATANWNEPEIQQLCQDLLDTLEHCPGVGVAAPQIGAAFRVFAVNVNKEPNNGLLVLINPEMIFHEGHVTGREGCLSIPEFTANVARYERVQMKGINPQGQEVLINSSGFEAICLQHELDHLDGVLFLDRVACLKNDVFKRKGGQPRYSLEEMARLLQANTPVQTVAPNPGGLA